MDLVTKYICSNNNGINVNSVLVEPSSYFGLLYVYNWARSFFNYTLSIYKYLRNNPLDQFLVLIIILVTIILIYSLIVAYVNDFCDIEDESSNADLENDLEKDEIEFKNFLNDLRAKHYNAKHSKLSADCVNPVINEEKVVDQPLQPINETSSNKYPIQVCKNFHSCESGKRSSSDDSQSQRKQRETQQLDAISNSSSTHKSIYVPEFKIPNLDNEPMLIDETEPEPFVEEVVDLPEKNEYGPLCKYPNNDLIAKPIKTSYQLTCKSKIPLISAQKKIFPSSEEHLLMLKKQESMRRLERMLDAQHPDLMKVLNECEHEKYRKRNESKIPKKAHSLGGMKKEKCLRFDEASLMSASNSQLKTQRQNIAVPLQILPASQTQTQTQTHWRRSGKTQPNANAQS